MSSIDWYKPCPTLTQSGYVLQRYICSFLTALVVKVFDMEMQSFFFLFTRYLTERAKSQDLYVIPTDSR
jgi:hypothetical protein